MMESMEFGDRNISFPFQEISYKKKKVLKEKQF